MMAEPPPQTRVLGTSGVLYAPYAKQRIYPPDLISDLCVTCSLAQRRERRQKVHGLMVERQVQSTHHHVFIRPSRRKAVTAFHSCRHTSARPRLFIFAIPRRAKAQSQ
jgi:hypothetical protein